MTRVFVAVHRSEIPVDLFPFPIFARPLRLHHQTESFGKATREQPGRPWASDTPESVNIASLVGAVDYSIHPGDTYYVGNSKEIDHWRIIGLDNGSDSAVHRKSNHSVPLTIP
jgi:hypothetical protein